MVVKNTLANTLSTLYNNELRGNRECTIYPASKFVARVLQVMQRNGYIGVFELIDDNRGGKFKVQLLGRINKCGIVSPRISVKHNEIEKFEVNYLPSRDIGIIIISTPQGIMTHKEAKEKGIGGVLVAYVY
ncbi:MAG: 30S ribosomal protein S8 [Thermoprotei archaeon]